MKKSEIELELTRLNGKLAFLENRIRELEQIGHRHAPISPPPLWPINEPMVLRYGSGKVTGG